MFISKGKSYNKNVSNIKIDGNNLQQVNKTKFLGIVIEEHLNWAMHISHLCNIIARNVCILQKLRYFIPAYVFKIIFSPSHISASTLHSVPARIMTCHCPRSSAISVVIWFLAISSLTRSSHLSFGRPRFRFPSTVICKIFLVASSLSRL